jgi:hypothetical protein
MSVRQAGRWVLGAVLALGLLALFFRGVNTAALAEAFRSANPWLLASVAGITVVMYAVRAWRWGLLLAPLTQARWRDLFSATVVGFMTGLVIPRAGEIVRPYLIGRRQGVSASGAFASIILERLIDLITVLLLFGASLQVLPLPAPVTPLSATDALARAQLVAALKLGGLLAALGAALALALLIAFHLRGERALVGLERPLGYLPERLAQPLLGMLRHFGHGLAVLQAPPAQLLALAGQSLLVWLLIAASLWLTNLAFGIHLPFHSTFLMLGFLTVGVAVPTPGMVGGFHEAYKLALTQAFGVPLGVAAAAGLAAHALTNLPVLALGLSLLAREGLTFGRVAQMSEEGHA